VDISDLMLSFTFPGDAEIELIPHGSDIFLNINNIELYCEKMVSFVFYDSILWALESFKKGF